MEQVSKSETGQDKPKPDREERDEAFSTGGGRKAVEEPKNEHKSDNKGDCLEAPLGLEIETKGDDEST